MIVAVDTDVLVNWQMAGAIHHSASRAAVERTVRDERLRLGLVPQVLHEFLHVTTDARRFDAPMPMAAAVRRARELWDSPDVERLYPGPETPHRTLALLDQLHLGRKRILATALAATLEAAGVRRLLTLNGRHYEVFPFLEVVDPLSR